MLADLQAAGVQGYSLGQPSGPGGKDQGTPNTFTLGFRAIATLPSPPAGGSSPSPFDAANTLALSKATVSPPLSRNPNAPAVQKAASQLQSQTTEVESAPQVYGSPGQPNGDMGIVGQIPFDLPTFVAANQVDGVQNFAGPTNQLQGGNSPGLTDLSNSIFPSAAKRSRRDALNTILLSADAYADSTRKT